MVLDGTNIKMTRGDSEYITVLCKNLSGATVPFVEGDKVYFTIKRSIHETTIILQKLVTTFINGKAGIDITPADTKDLQFMSYVYDVQLTTVGGDVTTLIMPSKFVIGGEVTYE